jgi:hypothetical protein
MKKLISVFAMSLLFLVGCASTPEVEEVEKVSTVCQMANAYIHEVNAKLGSMPDKTSARLIFCEEMPHGTAYFIYGAVSDIGGITGSGEVRVVIVLAKREAGWAIVDSVPFATALSPEAMKILIQRQQADSNKLEVMRDKDSLPAAEIYPL